VNLKIFARIQIITSYQINILMLSDRKEKNNEVNVQCDEWWERADE